MRQGCSGPDADGRPGPDARALAVQNAARNGFAVGGTRRLYAACGELGAGTDAEQGQRVFMVGNAVVADNTLPVSCDQPDDATLGAASGNAIRVVVCRTVPASLVVGGLFAGRTVALRAEATALRTEPTAVFRISPKLVSTNPAAPLMAVLRGVGVDLSETEVASAAGLANVKVTPTGLLKALGIPVAADISVADLNNLLAAEEVSVGDIVEATLDLVTQQGALGLDGTLLNTLRARLGIDQLPYAVAHGFGRMVAATIGRGDGGGEEILHLEQAARRQHIFIGGHPRDGRLMQFNFFCNIPKYQRLHPFSTNF